MSRTSKVEANIVVGIAAERCESFQYINIRSGGGNGGEGRTIRCILLPCEGKHTIISCLVKGDQWTGLVYMRSLPEAHATQELLTIKIAS